jgi:hypothetical protein
MPIVSKLVYIDQSTDVLTALCSADSTISELI